MTENIPRGLDAIQSDIAFLYKLSFLQRAEIDALREFLITEVADLKTVQRDIVFQRMSLLVRSAYDRHIENLEKSDPALAARIDLRSGLDSRLQDLWYFPSTNPTKDEPPDASAQT